MIAKTHSLVLLFVALRDGTPANETEVALNFARKCDFSVDLSAHVLAELYACHIVAHTHDSASTGSRTDVNQQDFAFFDVFNAHVVAAAYNTTQESRLDVDLDEDLGHLVGIADNVADHVV